MWHLQEKLPKLCETNQVHMHDLFSFMAGSEACLRLTSAAWRLDIWLKLASCDAWNMQKL